MEQLRDRLPANGFFSTGGASSLAGKYAGLQNGSWPESEARALADARKPESPIRIPIERHAEYRSEPAANHSAGRCRTSAGRRDHRCRKWRHPMKPEHCRKVERFASAIAPIEPRDRRCADRHDHGASRTSRNPRSVLPTHERNDPAQRHRRRWRARVVEDNAKAGRKIALAESCTGGLVAAALTEIRRLFGGARSRLRDLFERSQAADAGRFVRHHRHLRRGIDRLRLGHGAGRA